MNEEEESNQSGISDLSIELINGNEYWLSMGVAI
jgi:hypothetical protein